MKQAKQFLENLVNRWNQPKPTEEEIRVNGMMKICFHEKTTEMSIDTLIAFNEKAKQELAKRNMQAVIDNSICEHYFRNNITVKQVVTI